MGEASSFVEAIRAAAGELRLEPHTPVRLNRIAARIDQLGRRLHGLGWVRDLEIGGSLTAAVRELGLALGEPNIAPTEPVRRALVQLESALNHADEGLRPQQPAAVTEVPAEEVVT